MILAPLALFLIWEVVTKSIASYLADARPEMAIRLQSTNATAFLNLADEALDRSADAKNQPSPNEASSRTSDLKHEPFRNVDVTGGSPALSVPLADPQTNTHTRYWAERALLNDPLNARAYRILGQLAERASDDKQTQKLMQAAARRSLREGGAIYWMMVRSYQNQDYGAAIRYADVLMRIDPPKIRSVMMPIMGKFAENAEANRELKKILAGNPPWRPVFFDFLPENISDARTPLEILISLKNTPTPPTAAELRGYLNFLISHNVYDLAYYTWLQFLPSEQLGKVGRLFNGSFETNPTGLPFDWVMSPGSNVVMKILARPDQDRDRALFVELGPGRVDSLGVKQLVMLPPGGYHLAGKYRAEIDSNRSLRWRVNCAQGATIADISLTKTSGSMWKDFKSSFTVPEANCPAQYIELVFDARWASEQFVSGSLWCDDLQILRDDHAETRATDADGGAQTETP